MEIHLDSYWSHYYPEFNTFQVHVPILYRLKSPEIQSFSG